MAEFICPRFKTLQIALICDKPTKVNVDVTLKSISDAHGRSSLTFHDSLTLLAKFALLHQKTNRRLARNAEEFIKRRSEGRQGEKQTINWTDDTHAIEEALANEKEPVIRQELIMQYDELKAFGASSASEDSLKKWILEIPPTSPAWVYHLNLALSSSKVHRPDAFQYVNEIIAQHPNELFAKYLYDCERFGCHEIGDKNYSSTNWSSQARPQLPLSRVRAGDPVPHCGYNVQKVLLFLSWSEIKVPLKILFSTLSSKSTMSSIFFFHSTKVSFQRIGRRRDFGIINKVKQIRERSNNHACRKSKITKHPSSRRAACLANSMTEALIPLINSANKVVSLH
jgi:hypothetical protein